MIIRIVQLFILLTLALIHDFKKYKIDNRLVYSFMLIGVLTNVVIYDIDGIRDSLLGIIFPIIILFILFVLRMLGAGDIKLFSAIGAIMGRDFVLKTMIYSFMVGGIISFFVILSRKNGRKRIIYLMSYIKNCLLTLTIFPYENFDNKESGSMFRFSYGIVCGVLLHGCFLLF